MTSISIFHDGNHSTRSPRSTAELLLAPEGLIHHLTGPHLLWETSLTLLWSRCQEASQHTHLWVSLLVSVHRCYYIWLTQSLPQGPNNMTQSSPGKLRPMKERKQTGRNRQISSSSFVPVPRHMFQTASPETLAEMSYGEMYHLMLPFLPSSHHLPFPSLLLPGTVSPIRSSSSEPRVGQRVG